MSIKYFLELILTDDEKDKLHNVNGIHYFDKPLQLVELKKIYVQDKNIIKHMNIQIQNSENGFLPNELFDVYLKNKKSIFEKKSYSIFDDKTVDNYEKQTRFFNKRMGMFSFIEKILSCIIVIVQIKYQIIQNIILEYCQIH